MAIQIDRVVGWLPDRIGRELAHEIARGRGPLAEVVLPLNRELLSRQASIDSLTLQNEKLQFEVSALRASHAELRKALTRLCTQFPTDSDMANAGWENTEINEACNAYDAARAALSNAAKE